MVGSAKKSGFLAPGLGMGWMRKSCGQSVCPSARNVRVRSERPTCAQRRGGHWRCVHVHVYVCMRVGMADLDGELVELGVHRVQQRRLLVHLGVHLLEQQGALGLSL